MPGGYQEHPGAEHTRECKRCSQAFQAFRAGKQIFGQIWDIKKLETNTKDSGGRWKQKGRGRKNRDRSRARETG